MSDDRTVAAEALMTAFLDRTGVLDHAASGRRYLWTDAFAVMCLLGLRERTGRDRYLHAALTLVDRVHHVLGRRRADDRRRGWISGLDEADGARHPTAGGLRIGKPRPERGPDEPFDDRAEWDRDGQYFHYLTKWMHALDRVGRATGDPRYGTWALELAAAAHRGFVHVGPDGRRHVCWKMSIDLERPLVESTGQHDPLDGYVTCSRLLVGREHDADECAAEVRRARADFRAMCAGAAWATGDELGIGGLLADASQMAWLTAIGALDAPALLDDVLDDALASLRALEHAGRPAGAAGQRLPFRELGLAIGLHGAAPMLRHLLDRPDRFAAPRTTFARVEAIVHAAPLAERIERFWLDPGHRRAGTWSDHLDINTVMLATSLVPQAYLLDDEAPRARPRDDARTAAVGRE